MQIEIIYARADDPILLHFDIEEGITLGQMLNRFNVAAQLGIDLNQHKIGIYGQIITLNTALHAGDRIEIYCPLASDPKLVRIKRAKERK